MQVTPWRITPIKLTLNTSVAKPNAAQIKKPKASINVVKESALLNIKKQMAKLSAVKASVVPIKKGKKKTLKKRKKLNNVSRFFCELFCCNYRRGFRPAPDAVKYA